MTETILTAAGLVIGYGLVAAALLLVVTILVFLVLMAANE